MNFKVGDKVRLIRDLYGHGLPIGQIVTIYTIDQINYGTLTDKNVMRYFTDKELEPAYIKEFRDKLDGLINE